jgi:metal-dependent amidase/aminoacylase/carboxypeptidase family protein
MKDELVEIRRDIHSHPELSFAETRTASVAEKYLLAHGFEIRNRFLESGIIADLGEAPRIAIRCEMDALPLAEQNIAPYMSTIANVCHACGHDATFACVLGAAQLLHEAGASVRIIMQPGEEQPDAEGVPGARHAVQSGALEGITVLLGLHVDPTTTTGTIALLPIPVDLATAFTATVTAPNLSCKFEGQLSGTRKADYGDIKTWVEKKFGAKEFELIWRETAQQPAEIDTEPLLSALSFVSRNAQLSKRKTWSTSFSEYSKHVPCLLLLLGCEIRGDIRSQHTGRFDIDEDCLPIGAAALAALVRAL